jgi:MFS transporter, UMF1 family
MDIVETSADRMRSRRQKGSRSEIGAWAVYESSSNAFNTLIITFIFSRYFQGVIAPDEVIGLTWWTRALNISAIVVALCMPIMGAIADFSGRKKQFLFVTTAGCIAATSLLFFMQPGMMLTAVLIFIVANILFEAAAVFYNGFLPELTTTEKMGRISGFGWSMGYVGGLICLIIALAMIRLWEPADPYLNVRATTLLAAGWYLVFAIPLFLMVRERQRRRSAPLRMYIGAGFRRVGRTFRQLRVFQEAAKLLLARLIYNDGLVVIFGMAAIYVGTVYGMGFDDIIILAIVVNIAAAIGAFAFGFLNDIIGAKKTIAITLVVLTAATLLGATAPDMRTFWVAAIVIGLMVGPNQSASRAMLATFTPERKQGEFFGFFAFSGKLSSVAGPFLYGTVAAVSGSQRIAMASIMVFFIVGLALLMRVDEQRGVEMARKATLAGVGDES